VEEWEALRVLRIPRSVVQALLDQLDRDELVEVDLSSAAPMIPKQLSAPYGIESAVVVALRRGQELIGVLTAGFRTARKLTHVQHRVARGVAHMASLALENVRLLEEVQSANRLKSEFVATMSHELRTPLNIILGYGSLLRDGEFGDMNEEQAHILRLLDQNARQLLDLINATLDLSRLEAGRVPIDIQEVDVAEVVAEVGSELQPLADEKLGIQFVADVGRDLGEIHTDRGKLKLILKNLVGNAYKYSDEGPIAVQVTGSPHWIDFEVSDCGPGISPELRPHIFEAFRQGSSGLSRTHGGVGLGLYIVVRLLELLGGSITVSTELGEGSVFHFRVPRSPRARAAQQAIAQAKPPE
jgi:signal transduction histidine kinase